MISSALNIKVMYTHVHVCSADSFLIVCELVLPASSLLAIIAESLIPGHPRKRLDIVRSISLMVVLKVVPSRIGIVPFKLHKLVRNASRCQ